MVITETLLFVIGLVLLVKGSDFFVSASVRIATQLGVSEFVIGLTLVALGTSIPELGTSVVAAFKHQSGIVMGNVLGSNIANIGLIIGIAAVVWVLKTDQKMLMRDGFVMLLAAVLFYVFMFNEIVSRVEGFILLLLYVIYILFVVETKSRLEGVYNFKDFVTCFFKFAYIRRTGKWIFQGSHGEDEDQGKEIVQKGILLRDLGIIILSIIAVWGGAKFLVDGAVFFAHFFHVPQTIIGLSLIAIGTSLPELGVTLSAGRKGLGNIVVGNIIGSNIANIFLIIGVSSIISPLSVIKSTVVFTAPFMIVMTILFLLCIRLRWKIERIEAILFLLLYAAFLGYIVM